MVMMSIGNRVRERREALQMTQDELAKKLGYKSRSSINKIELGLTDIAQSKISLFAKVLKTTPAFLMGLEHSKDAYESLHEQLKLAGWDIHIIDDGQKEYLLTKQQYQIHLNHQDFHELFSKVSDFLNQELLTFQNQMSHRNYLHIPYYGRLVSAGFGQHVFDDLASQTIEIEDTEINRQADFAVAVNGDSMVPTYQDHDLLLVKKQTHLEMGEIGIFLINGEAYVKELGQQCLISHNKSYQPIYFDEHMRIDCIGKVIAKHTHF